MAACHYCGEPKAKTEDHIVPKALGGTDAYINRVAACRRCNAWGENWTEVAWSIN